MLIIKNEKELDKFKKIEDDKITYEFHEDVVFDFALANRKNFDELLQEKLKDCKTNYEKAMLVLENDFLPRIIFKGQSMTFNKNVDWIDRLKLDGNLICKGEINGGTFRAGGNVEAKKIVCHQLFCENLTGGYVSVEDLFCKGDINCEMLKCDHITSCKKLNADVMTFNGTMLYHVSAIGEDLSAQQIDKKV